MVAKKAFVNYYNFKPTGIWVQHASIHVKSTGTVVKSKKIIVKVYFKINSEPGLEPKKPVLKPEPKKYLLLRGAGVGAGAE
jgi:hypothetical protein